MADVLLKQLILQPAPVEQVMLVGLHNEQDASTVSYRFDPRIPYASWALGRPSVNPEVVLFSRKSDMAM
jgi:hypothetical protein